MPDNITQHVSPAKFIHDSKHSKDLNIISDKVALFFENKNSLNLNGTNTITSRPFRPWLPCGTHSIMLPASSSLFSKNVHVIPQGYTSFTFLCFRSSDYCCRSL